ncbi:MAG: 16S rRNA processing protein RimM [Chloroflexi bacterium]|nr:16S rRNA processing protein RimM [Chloroflexota bacterium]
MKRSGYIAVGRIVGPHGVRGEMRVEVYTDFPERFEPGAELWVEGESRSSQVVSARPHKQFLLVKLDRFSTRTDVEPLRNRHLLIPRERAASLPEGEYYSDELEGLRVITTQGRELGVIQEVLWTGANEVYVVMGEFGEILIPAIADVVKEVDIELGRMLVSLIPGLAPAIDAIEAEESGPNPY